MGVSVYIYIYTYVCMIHRCDDLNCPRLDYFEKKKKKENSWERFGGEKHVDFSKLLIIRYL